MKRLLVVLFAAVLFLPDVCSASAFDHVETDKVAHAAVSYVICDQLKRAGMNDFWSAATTLAIGAAKEKWIDDHWDGGDFAADCAGVLMFQVRF